MPTSPRVALLGVAGLAGIFSLAGVVAGAAPSRDRPRTVATVASVATPAAPPPAPAAPPVLAALVDAYLAEYAARYPTEATDLGIHTHDAELEDLSPLGRDRELAWLRSWDERLARVPTADRDEAVDLRLLQHELGRRRFHLTRLQEHRQRPNLYIHLASASVYGLIKRDFAPIEARLRLVLAREARIPALLDGAPRQLDQMSPAAVDIALRELAGARSFFARDVPIALAAATAKDPAAKRQLEARTAEVVAALERLGAFLRGPAGKRASAPFALGEALFRERLHWDEMIEEPVPALLSRAEGELRRLQQAFADTTARIAKGVSPAQVQALVQRDHPATRQVIPETQARIEGLRRFLREHDLVSVPSDQAPLVQETPPFRRATSIASMDTPGPFETAAREAYYSVTLPEPDWPADKTEDFLRGAYPRPLIDVVSIHEVFPGHYLQYLWSPRLSKIRRVIDVTSNSEGWAHYTEQLMLDEGYGGDSPALRLMQLQDALLRAARFVAAIRMHTRGMTYDQAVRFFQDEGRQTKNVAELEARRGTQDPMYLCYTYGKLEILRLRDAYQRRLGKAFTLRRFHDALLAQGRIPLPLVEQALLAAQ